MVMAVFRLYLPPEDEELYKEYSKILFCREDSNEPPSDFFRFLNLQNKSVAAQFDSCSE